MSEPLYDDPVVAEIHAIRAKMLAECGGDHRKLMEQVRQRQEASARTIIKAPPPPERTKQCASAADSTASREGSSSRDA